MKKKIFVYLALTFLLLPAVIPVSSSMKSGTKGWEQVVDNGFGNQNNVYAWSMKSYSDYLYVGTLNYVDGCQIYRSSTGDKGTWKQVNKDGFGNDFPSGSVYKKGARNMIVYKDLLWVVTSNRETGTQIWVTNGEEEADGLVAWRQANENGFGEDTEVFSSRALAIYKDKLYIGSRTEDKGAHIYRYDGPTEFNNIEPDNWTFVNKDWQDNPDHNPLFCVPGFMINFTAIDEKDDYLYVAVFSAPAPPFLRLLENFSIKRLIRAITAFFMRCAIWRYNGSLWEKVSDKGFGKSNIVACSAVVLNNSLYFGTGSKFGGQIWKTNDGKNWTNIIRHGFGRPSNVCMWWMNIYEDRLVVGTFNFLRGCEIWISTNDNPNSKNDFKKINENGMDREKMGLFLPQQYGARTFESFGNQLYVGTNSWIATLKIDGLKPGDGCEVWRINNI
jgi:hypothetical protein